MRRSTKTITLVLIGTATLMTSCSQRSGTESSQGETTGTKTHRRGVGFLPMFLPWGGGGRRQQAVTQPVSAASGNSTMNSPRSSRGGFGSSGRGYVGG